MREHVEEETERNKEDIQEPTTQDVKDLYFLSLQNVHIVYHDQAGHNCCYESCTTPQPRPHYSLYALAMEIQWINPHTMREEKLVVMLGGLHID